MVPEISAFTGTVFNTCVTTGDDEIEIFRFVYFTKFQNDSINDKILYFCNAIRSTQANPYIF
jgi:hypothetical protein